MISSRIALASILVVTAQSQLAVVAALPGGNRTDWQAPTRFPGGQSSSAWHGRLRGLTSTDGLAIVLRTIAVVLTFPQITLANERAADRWHPDGRVEVCRRRRRLLIVHLRIG